MKVNSTIYPVLLAVLLLSTLFSCKKEVLPTVTVASVTNITANSATSGGEIIADGGVGVTARGVCWSTNQNPTTTDNKTTNGTGLGSFSSSITGLTPGVTYTLKAYAINAVGTAYSSPISFSTLALAPVLNTTDVSAITSSSVNSGGNVTNDGGSPVTARGVCWSTGQNPTIADSKTTDGTGSGIFTSAITGLTPGSTYYIRAYATNSIGTAYGNQVTATTIALLPTITTTTVSAITATTALSGGNITSDGGALITQRGVCWSTNHNPTVAENKSINGSGSGSFTSSITGLTLGSTYYVRAYATNSVGTSYGNEVSFITVVLTVTDIDGNVYSTVAIGNQVWMAANLKTTKYRNGNIIPTTNNAVYLDKQDELYPFYQWEIYPDGITGRLYTWYVAADTRGLCPTGWHLPTEFEWDDLVYYLGGAATAGGKLKESGTAHWTSPNTGATNESGFNAIPGGYLQFDWWYGFEGLFFDGRRSGSWWSRNGTYAAMRSLRIQSNQISIEYVDTSARNGLSVRCIKD
jgi:uncharacterized protein (TIGR02145 family)